MIRTRMSVKIALLTVATTFSIAASGQPPSSAIPAPELKKGDRWEYVTIDRWTNAVQSETIGEVIEANEKTVRLKWQNKKTGAVSEAVYTNELNTIEVGIGAQGHNRFSPADHAFSFPLEAGKSWKGELVLEQVNQGRRIRWETTVRVVSWETVKTPAGAFEALRIERNGFYNRMDSGGASGTLKWTYWYSPKAKRSVRVEYEDKDASGRAYNNTVTELVSHSLN